MAGIPGAFPEDDVVAVPSATAKVPPKREMVLSEKGLREMERKQKMAEKNAEFAPEWESWRANRPEDWNKHLFTADTLPEDAKPAENAKQNPRVPPGNHLSRRMLVMDLHVKPEGLDILDGTYQLCVTSALGTINLTMDDIRSLGEENYTADFHCVTKWSALDVKWTGVPFSKVVERCRSVIPSDWKFLLESSVDGYTTNVPRQEVDRPGIYLVYGLYDQVPIPLDHGSIRILKPHLYGWKSAKWLEKIEFATEDSPGFWEQRGFNRRANAWAEGRYGKPEDAVRELGPEFNKSGIEAA